MIRATPLLGGVTEGGVCCLLEIGEARLLLDCGLPCNAPSSSAAAPNPLYSAEAIAASGGIDAVILSHADANHMGGLPIIFGKSGLGGVPVICTVPVYKFGQLMLYDHCLNSEMEGVDPDAAKDGSARLSESLKYELDDVDMSLSNVHCVRYSQTISLFDVCGHHKQVSLCAYSSGRTIGGSIWRIRHGATEVLYMMDVNLKKELVLDGANLDLLPSVPSLMIVDGSSSANTSTGVRRKKGEKGADSQAMIATIMETLRSTDKGNILIPCETGGRALELLQLLGKHWLDNKLGLDHLVFLSHMSHNVIEFARSQLEWMSDSLTKPFFNGKQNPFELPVVKLCSTVREVEKLSGSKVVIATDSSLSRGLSKELLLRWGGDPRCKVIFTDINDSESLAAELKKAVGSTTGPLVVTVTKPIRVELVGDELSDHLLEVEARKRVRDEAEQKKKREQELNLLIVNRQENLKVELLDGVIDDSTSGAADADAASGRKRKAVKGGPANKFAKFVEPTFPMFAGKDSELPYDDYGCSIGDLKFHDVAAVAIKRVGTANVYQPHKKQEMREVDESVDAGGLLGLGEEKKLVPWKLVPVKVRTQFTCSMKDFSLGSRADLKAMRTVLNKLTPRNVVVLRGSAQQCEDMRALASSVGGVGMARAPSNGEVVEYKVHAGRVRLQLPPTILTSLQRSVKGMTIGGGQESVCTVSALRGRILEAKEAATEGIRVVWLQRDQSAEDQAKKDRAAAAAQEAAAAAQDQAAESTADTTMVEAAAPEKPNVEEEVNTTLDGCSSLIGMVSVGEVTFDRLLRTIQKLREGGEELSVEYREGVLLLGGQVAVRKENENDFVVEGPPLPVFWEVRRALYQQFCSI